MATRTHTAVVTVAPRASLETIQMPTLSPEGDEVRVRVEWVASTPLDLHQADGGLLVKHPQILGDSIAGTVLEVGPAVQGLKVDDKVFGFVWREPKEKAYQEFIVTPEWLLGVVPAGLSLQEAATLPDNVVTAFNATVTDLKLSLPWPKPENYAPPHAADPVLIWGAASSVGQYSLQVLRYFGYTNLIAVASPSNHDYLRGLGATQTFSYRDDNVVELILQKNASIPYILDCIASLDGSLKPISKIAKSGSIVAAMMPVIHKHSSEDSAPEYSFDVAGVVDWAEGVEALGVRTHFYLQNELFKQKLQSEIVPQLVAEGVIKPNRYQIIEGSSLLERAQKALDTLRSGVSGERLVWRISEV